MKNCLPTATSGRERTRVWRIENGVRVCGGGRCECVRERKKDLLYILYVGGAVCVCVIALHVCISVKSMTRCSSVGVTE